MDIFQPRRQTLRCRGLRCTDTSVHTNSHTDKWIMWLTVEHILTGALGTLDLMCTGVCSCYRLVYLKTCSIETYRHAQPRRRMWTGHASEHMFQGISAANRVLYCA